ncbi:B12-binding domain-containing radical SAM protein [Micromonospora sp. C95]|uniref:B12-binding domain-containing radical SAM protein n=1 Tax=Micromonospora sp. C95 TaxID=2824882 RepID=UPI001B3900C8|nr:cobalamin-dependent protein [Micromonospora sp. C95]MBQ1026040.1 cobalamin-dependent protein [Micromonospora sp. C95]
MAVSVSDTLKAVLVVPPLIHAGVAFTSVAGPEHIGVAYLAASLRRAGFDAKILNFDLETYLRVMRQEGFLEIQPDPEDMARQILAEDADFCGITVTGPTLETSLRLAAILKERRPDLHVCFGGHQATAAAEALLKEEPYIDSIGVGDCDFTLPAFLQRMHAGESLEDCDGFFVRRADGSLSGGWRIGARKGDLLRISLPGVSAPSPPPQVADRYALWDLPHPARDDLAKIRAQTGANEARLSTSRGCMDFCTFCATSDRAGFRRHTLRPPDDVVREIEDLHERFGINHFWLVDDNFVSRSPQSQERASGICNALLQSPLKITMRAYFRADAFDGRNDLIPLMFRAGVTMGLIGVESAAPRRLKYFGKQCTTDQVRTTISAIRSVGMGLQIGYIFYDPLTSFPDMREDTDFLLEIGEAYNLFNFAQSMDVYPGTPYRRMIQKKGLGHFEHPYRGGFRRYEYEDPRIAPLAVAMDTLYSAPLMAIDRSLMRLRAFNLPRLLWLDQGNHLSDAVSSVYRSINEEAEELFDLMAMVHHKTIHAAIDNAEDSFDMEVLESCFRSMRAERRPYLQRLERLAKEADQMASANHARINGLPPSGTMEREDAEWPI